MQIYKIFFLEGNYFLDIQYNIPSPWLWLSSRVADTDGVYQDPVPNPTLEKKAQIWILPKFYLIIFTFFILTEVNVIDIIIMY